MGRHADDCTTSVQQKWPEMAKLVTDEMVHAFAAVGTYDGYRERDQAALRRRQPSSHSTCR